MFGNLLRVQSVFAQTFEPNLENIFAIGQIFIAVNGQVMKIKSDHLVTLQGDLRYCEEYSRNEERLLRYQEELERIMNIDKRREWRKTEKENYRAKTDHDYGEVLSKGKKQTKLKL